MSAKEFTGRRVVVMGLGSFGGGIGVTRWLADRGAEVTVTDKAPPEKLTESLDQLRDVPVHYHLGRHDECDLDGCDLLVVSPAVPKDRSEFVQAARARGIPISSEMNLFIERCPARRVIGITGSVGKSTTTAMLHTILDRASGPGSWPRAWLGGNIGQSLLGELEAIGPHDVVVLELSSFQLEDLAALPWSPHIAVITNIRPNHLDRHGTLEAYAEAKLNIVRFQSAGDLVFVHEQQEDVAERIRALGAGGPLRRYAFDPAFAGVLRVPGAHNRENAAAAIAVARALAVSDDAISAALSDFRSLPHRLEFVAEHEGVRYYNDSKSTTPESTLIALEAFDRPAIMLVGGGDKGMPFDELARRLAFGAKAVICYGETGPGLYEAVTRGSLGASRAARVELAGSFEDAVSRAKAVAAAGDVVVLSPACTSYDMFTNYERRGEAFCSIVRARTPSPPVSVQGAAVPLDPPGRVG